MKKTWLGIIGAGLLGLVLALFVNNTTSAVGNSCAKRILDAFEAQKAEAAAAQTSTTMMTSLTAGDEKGTDEMKAEYHKITTEQAKTRIESGDDVVILDVRTAQEYDEAHIVGAVWLANENIGGEMPAQLPDKDAEILVYCRSGNRSEQAAKKLVALGYTRVYDFGGINSWTGDVEATQP